MDITNTTLDEILALARKEMEIDQREIHVVELLHVYLKYRPHDGRTWLSYGECLRLVGRHDESINAMLTSLNLAPEEKRPTIYGRLGFLCNQHRSPQEAESWYCLGTNNEYCSEGWVWLLRGINLYAMGNNKQALECFNESSNFDDVDKSEIALNRGLVQRACGNYNEAISSFKQALELDPDYTAAMKCLEGLQGISKTLDLIRNIENQKKRSN